jgi:hypothetical protein
MERYRSKNPWSRYCQAIAIGLVAIFFVEGFERAVDLAAINLLRTLKTVSSVVEVLGKTQTLDSPEWLERLTTLQEAHSSAMEQTDNANMTGPEASRLNRL